MKQLLLLLFLSFVSCKSDEKKPLLLPTKQNDFAPTLNIKKETKTATSDSSTFVPFLERFLVERAFQEERTNKTISVEELFQSEKDFIPFLHTDTLSLFETKLEGTLKQDIALVDFDRNENWRYEFEHNEDDWTLKNLKKINKRHLSDKEFISFLIVFSNDSVFQKKHIVFPLSRKMLDNDYEVVSEKTTLEQWKYFNLTQEMGSLVLLPNIKKRNAFRNIYYRGKYNGIWVKYTFQKIKNEWFLIKTEDYST